MVACAVTLLCVGIATERYIGVEEPKWYFRDAAKFINDKASEDAIVIVGLLRGPIEHQLKRLEDRHEILSFPSDVANHIGWMDYSMSPTKLAEEVSRLSGRLANQKTVWIVARHDGRGKLVHFQISELLLETLMADGRELTDVKAYGIVIVLGLARNGSG